MIFRSFKSPASGKENVRFPDSPDFENSPDFRTGRDVRLSPSTCLWNIDKFEDIYCEKAAEKIISTNCVPIAKYFF